MLQQQMEHAPVPLRFGTLVVFTDGTDRAHRASDRGRDARARRRRQHVRHLRHRRRPGGRQQAAVAHRPVGDVRVAEQGRRAARVRRDLGAHRGGVEEASTCCRIARRAARANTRSRSRRTAPGPAAGSPTGSTPTASGPNCDPNQRPAFDMKHPRQAPPPEAQPKTTMQRPPPGGPAAQERRQHLDPEALVAPRHRRGVRLLFFR